MITFKQYLLTENIVYGVRINILGLSPSEELLPSSAPYGFWVDRSGNYKSIPSFSSGGHAQAAKEIIMNAYDYKDETNTLTRDEEREFSKAVGAGFNSLYKILFELNYMHVVKGGNTYYHYNTEGSVITTSQLRFLNNLKQTYRTDIERSKEIY
jgi:hypothetical protein